MAGLRRFHAYVPVCSDLGSAASYLQGQHITCPSAWRTRHLHPGCPYQPHNPPPPPPLAHLSFQLSLPSLVFLDHSHGPSGAPVPLPRGAGDIAVATPGPPYTQFPGMWGARRLEHVSSLDGHSAGIAGWRCRARRACLASLTSVCLFVLSCPAVSLSGLFALCPNLAVIGSDP